MFENRSPSADGVTTFSQFGPDRAVLARIVAVVLKRLLSVTSRDMRFPVTHIRKGPATRR